VAGSWTNRFLYDGNRRLRIKKEYKAGITSPTNEIRYVYDGMLPIQERNSANLPVLSLTRGRDLSGKLDGAGGIGGLLARTDQAFIDPFHALYHADLNGNVTCLINQEQIKVASYIYDSFGKVIGASGPLAEANKYQYSSKELQATSGLIYFGYRFYDANLQRWLNRDPLGEAGGLNLFSFVKNSPTELLDSFGLRINSRSAKCGVIGTLIGILTGCRKIPNPKYPDLDRGCAESGKGDLEKLKKCNSDSGDGSAECAVLCDCMAQSVQGPTEACYNRCVAMYEKNCNK